MDTPQDFGSINLLQYMGIEEQNLLVSIYTLHAEINFLENVNMLFEQARPRAPVRQASALILQLLNFSHAQLFVASSMVCRCHVEEALSSLRVAVEAALHAYRIVQVRASPAEYVCNERHGQGNVRHLRDLHKQDPDAHSAIAPLLDIWSFCSSFATHADYRVIKDRSVIVERPEGLNVLIKINNCQPPTVQQYLLLTISLYFCDILGVFAQHLREVVGSISGDWDQHRINLFNQIHDAREQLRPRAIHDGPASDSRLDDLLAGRLAI